MEISHSFLVRIFVAAIAVGLGGCHSPTIVGEEPENIGDPTWPLKVPDGPVDFRKHVRPILIINCLECHNSKDAKENGGFNLETKKLAMTTGSKPPALVPGKPDESMLIDVLKLGVEHHKSMPPAPDKIWGVRMEILRKWIREGAPWPDNVRLVHPRKIKKW
ncbi:MAG: hypothetical protein HKN23_01495 [Verrucomicrobiales bacterium]|nr:hypothetical protein [Verrucomicrobiales bacterium]